jgi:anti-sigma factor RsiW
MTTADPHLNTGSMALDALPQDEAAAFSVHLETCPTCSAELTGFLETAALLGSSVAQTPPASLRRTVMQAIAVTPQLPPLTGPAQATDPAWGRHRTDADEVAPVEVADEVQGPPTNPLATVIAMRRPWYRRPQSLLAAAVAALVIGGGVTAVVATRSPAQQTAAECVAGAADKTTITPTTGAAVGGTVTLVASCDTAVVNMPKLDDAPAGKVYQVWVIKGKTASSVKVLKNNSGTPESSFDAEVHAGASAIGVTLEPAPAGSAAPTTDPIWVVPLAG